MRTIIHNARLAAALILTCIGAVLVEPKPMRMKPAAALIGIAWIENPIADAECWYYPCFDPPKGQTSRSQALVLPYADGFALGVHRNGEQLFSFSADFPF